MAVTLLSSQAGAAPRVGVQLTNLGASYRSLFTGAASTLATQNKNYSAAMAIQQVELIVALYEGTENTIVMWGDEQGNGYAFAGQAYFTGIMDLNAIGEIAQRDGMLQVYDAKDMAGRYTVAAGARKMLGLAY